MIMNDMKLFLYIFLYVIILCPLFGFGNGHMLEKGGHLAPRADKEHRHQIVSSKVPCDVCPRGGRCVPRVQCPAHVRRSSHNPECHIGGSTGSIGICCVTGYRHAAESDVKSRSSNTISVADIKASHTSSQQKLKAWMNKAEELLIKRPDVVVNVSSPSFGHHLSVVTHDKMADILGKGGLLNLFATQELKSRQAVSDEEVVLALTARTDGPFCRPPPRCPPKLGPYRIVGGECNNAAVPSWGAVHTGYERLLPPDYSDGIWAMRVSTTGYPLPSARVISHHMLFDVNNPSATKNLVFMQFGQFIAHDTTNGVIFNIGNGSAISCCVGDGVAFLPEEYQHGACAPIAADPGDGFYRQFNHQCLNFVRTQLAPSHDCSVGYAQQMNGVTHFIDMSNLYGSSIEKMNSLRGPGGLLKTFVDYGRELPPLTSNKECQIQRDGAACFESGDSHGNQVISLTVLHTLWTREHNRIARALVRLNPDWNEETVFFEARRIVQAEYQHIIYNEWLPLLLGPQFMSIFGLSPSVGYAATYDPHVNPSLTAEFATAALRFGHSVVDNKLTLPNMKTGDLYEAISLPEVMFEPSRLRVRPFLDRILVGMSAQPMQNVDPFVTESLTRYLFHGGNPFGLDLASINIQRGRDYGVRSYNEYRRLIGEPPYTDFNQFSPSAAERLSSVYQSPEDVDLWVGGLLEEIVLGGTVGSTFANIIADQFFRSKRGDRFFYEHGPDVNPGAFTLSQLAEIKKVTLARVICDNRDAYELITQPPKAFLRADLIGNEPVPCDSPLIPRMDLSRFKVM